MGEKAEINGIYSVLLICLGICIGHYITPYFFDEGSVFKQGAVYGILSYKDYLSKKATFNYMGDSAIVIITANDSLVIYK
tara:strand:+ start:6736 stop:6975 length:240 start_codon:yes stop_codon:yes gene_type:complete